MDQTTEVKEKPAAPPKPQYVLEAKALYDTKLKEFADKRQELIDARNAFKAANTRFKEESQTPVAA
jgi:hypothetical protein